MANPISTKEVARGNASPTIDQGFWMRVYRAMLAARLTDEHEASLIAQGEAYFHVSGAGHETTALMAEFLRPGDYLHLHYRDKALMIGRGIPIAQFFHSLFGTAGSHSQGRQMSAHISDPALNVLSIVGPVGNQALQAVGVAATLKARKKGEIVFCSLGDGTTQQGEVLEAIAEAVRENLPVIFWIADNQLSISTRTVGRTFFSRPDGEATEFYGLPIQRLDGRDPGLCSEPVLAIVESVRKTSRPALVVCQVERLSDHTNADDEAVYRSDDERNRARETGDPLVHLASRLHEEGVSPEVLETLKSTVQAEVEAAVEVARRSPGPKATFDAKRPLPEQGNSVRLAAERSPEGFSGGAVGRQVTQLGIESSSKGLYTMTEAIRGVLERWLDEDPRVQLLGQDIEDPKGDVFGVTRGLSGDFPGRVRNAPLSESTIVGVGVGRALAGDRPVAMLQFSDFLPLALNQVISEMATMYWRTAGGWECPMIVMAPSGGYRPGLGPFHAQSFETLAAHVPGLDVLVPSNAGDAARLLNAAFESGRPTLFFYPKALLHTRDQLASESSLRESAPLGLARFVFSGEHLTLVAWGNAVPLCARVAQALQTLGFTTDLLDLRSLSPWDRAAVIQSAQKTLRVLVVHEENLTAGFAAEVLASVGESVTGQVRMKRVTRADTFVPFEFANQSEVLPSFETILEAAAELLELDVAWSSPLSESDDAVIVRARGASPTDQETMVVDWRVEPGQKVCRGDTLAELESDKAITELASPVDGVVMELLSPVGEKMPVGTPVARIAPEVESEVSSPIRRGPVERQPRLIRRVARRSVPRSREQTEGTVRRDQVWMSRPFAATGSLSVSNALLSERFAGRSADEIFRLCGIESRRRVAGTENALSLAVAAAARALTECGLRLSDLSAIICHTTTPLSVTPAMASQIHAALSQDSPHTNLAAYDLHAACSGFLYSMQTAFDSVIARPGSRVLVVTTEEMSRVVDPRDFDTAILFGDAATATIVGGEPTGPRGGFLARRPALFSKPDETEALSVPNPGSGFVSMRGREVFSEAVRSMMHSLTAACEQAELNVGDLAHIVPHQANGRILEAMRARLGSLGNRVISNIARNGNTSSSSIPLCLAESADRFQPGDRIGTCAFGGGFTWGAGLLQAL